MPDTATRTRVEIPEVYRHALRTLLAADHLHDHAWQCPEVDDLEAQAAYNAARKAWARAIERAADEGIVPDLLDVAREERPDEADFRAEKNRIYQLLGGV